MRADQGEDAAQVGGGEERAHDPSPGQFPIGQRIGGCLLREFAHHESLGDDDGGESNPRHEHALHDAKEEIQSETIGYHEPSNRAVPRASLDGAQRSQTSAATSAAAVVVSRRRRRRRTP